MNAYELADDLENSNGLQYITKVGLVSLSAQMLRQQAEKINNMEIWEKKYLDRIAELEKEKIRAYDNGFEDGQKSNTQLHPLSDEEIKLIKGVVGDYVCTLKMEIDQQKQAFKGYEHCSNLDGLNNELKDSEQALAILKKASEK